MTVLPEQMYRMARQASDEINKGASAYFVVLGVLGTALAQMTKEGQPTPGVYENYREPGEFGEGVTVRQAPAPVQHVGATGTQEFTLRAMAQNYSGGHSWDHLDGEVCLKAADEIRRLRLELAATIREGISAVADARQTPSPQPNVEGSDLLNRLDAAIDKNVALDVANMTPEMRQRYRNEIAAHAPQTKEEPR